ncbi:hypothetical protein FQN57_007484 [Myotisia sp. PD_48]|nr:hypothetical protein FQN57_007484 [Myotisia sp. PD_48]
MLKLLYDKELGVISSPTESVLDPREEKCQSPISLLSTTSVCSPISNWSTNVFEVSTIKPSVYSGFEYHQRIFENGISPMDWKRFSDELVKAFELTTAEKIAAWTIGVSVGIVSAVPLLVFGAAPGYYAGKAVKSLSIEQKVLDCLEEEGELITVLKTWNSMFFQKRGLSVKLALPRNRSKDQKSKTFDSLKKPIAQSLSFGRKGKDKDSLSSKSDDDDKKKEEKKLQTRYRLVIEITGTDKKSESEPSVPLPVGKIELEGDDGTNVAPSYSAGRPPPYQSGAHVAELEGGVRNGMVSELDGNGNAIVELPGSTKKPVYELA